MKQYFRLLIFSVVIGINQAYANGETLVAGNNIAVVQTESGKVQGYIHRDILTYKGIPYATAKRFMPPEKVVSWQEEKLTITYGDVCPQVPMGGRSFFFTGPEMHESEQCLNLNIWTPVVGSDSPKRAVMVWITV